MEKNHDLDQEIKTPSQSWGKKVYRFKTNIFNSVESKANARHAELEINMRDLQCRKFCVKRAHHCFGS